jgi:hypothetical protein
VRPLTVSQYISKLLIDIKSIAKNKDLHFAYILTKKIIKYILRNIQVEMVDEFYRNF